MSLHAWAERGPDELTDEELDAREYAKADAIEDRADQERKGER